MRRDLFVRRNEKKVQKAKPQQNDKKKPIPSKRGKGVLLLVISKGGGNL